MSDTIFALATARGKAGVSVIRISGPLARGSAAALGATGLKPRRASLRQLSHNGEVIDEAIALYFPEGQSFTGEEIVELQCHGSSAIVAKLLHVLSGIDGLRLAEPGEFTRRALANGQLDLTQVEGLADLIDAETEAQRKQAQRVLSGAIGQKVEVWRGKLLRAAALVEATIDFADEDVPVDVTPEVEELLLALRQEFIREMAGSRVAERIREGYEVALLGAPNAGKSSLLNALSGRDAAITSSVAGTTRDIIEVRMDVSGLAVTLLDTAGLRDTENEIEQAGIDRARSRAMAADLRIMLVDPGQETPVFDLRPDDIVVVVKQDIYPDDGQISSRTGEGLDWLMGELAGRLQDRASSAGVLVRARHRIAVENANRALDSALERLYEGGEQAELIAMELRSAILSLESLIGQIGVEDLLGEIFASFCIGK